MARTKGIGKARTLSSAPVNAATKEALRQGIDTGQIVTMEALEQRLDRLGWTLRRVRPDEDGPGGWISAGPPDGRGTRFQVPFKPSWPKPDGTVVPRTLQDRWIYALFARADDRAACYIEHASGLTQRIRSQHEEPDARRNAHEFHFWTRWQSAKPSVVLLERIRGADCTRKTKLKATAQARVLRWTRSANERGYETPGVERWAPAYADARPVETWPDPAIKRAAWPLQYVAKRGRPMDAGAFALDGVLE